MSILSDTIRSLSPTSYWKFGEASGASTAVDDMGVNNGTYTSFGGGGCVPGAPTIVAGDPGNSVRLVNSAGGGIIFGDIFNFTGSAPFTAIVFGRLIAYNSGSGHIIFDNAGAGVNGWSLDLENPAVVLGGFRCDASACDHPNVQLDEYKVTGATRLYSICYDGTNLKVGIDGTYVATIASSRSMTNDTGGLGIGVNVGGGSAWDGWLQHGAIFSRALSEIELRRITRAASGVTGNSPFMELRLNEPSLQSYWCLDDVGPVFADSKGSVDSTLQGVVGLTTGVTPLDMYPGSYSTFFDRSVPGCIGFGDFYNFTNRAPYTIEFLFRPMIMDSNANYCYTKLAFGASGHGLDFGDTFVRCSRWDAAGVGDAAITFTPLQLKATHLIAADYDGTNLNLYINGALAAGPTTSTRNISSAVASSFSIGAFSDLVGNSSDGCTGYIDSFAVYNASLGAAKHLQHYQALQYSDSRALDEAITSTLAW